MTNHQHRRTVLASLASAVTGAGLVAAAGSKPASAAVTLGQLSAADHDVALRDAPDDVRVSCEVGYRWEIPAGQPAPSIFEVRLLAGQSETEIGKVDGRASQHETSSVQSITASLLASDDFTPGDFTPADEPQVVDVPLGLELEVIGGSQTLATASQQTTGQITVSQAGYDAAVHGSVGGNAAFTVEE